MPFVTIELLEGRTPETIEKLIINVTDTICKTLGASKESVRIVVKENPKTHWGIGGVTAKKLGK